jgi:hypothetical protein
LSSRPTNLDAILRTAYLAWTLGTSGQMIEFVEKSNSALADAGATRRAEPKQRKGSMGGKPGPEAFRWLRTVCDAARLEAHARALKDIAEQTKTQAKKKKKTR